MKTLKAKIPVCKAGGGFVHKEVSGTENGIYLRVESRRKEDTALK
jgi:hypothetical protein